MIRLRDFRDLTRHLPPDTVLGISFDEQLGADAIVLRTPDSKGGETVIDCGSLNAIEDDEEE